MGKVAVTVMRRQLRDDKTVYYEIATGDENINQ
jgi:hypothetical protein